MPLITPEILLKAYAAGIFPMAESADDPGLFWVEPKRRGIIPLDGLIVPSRLARTVRSDKYIVHVNRDFEAVISGCAAAANGRETTWINARIRDLYGQLFDLGHVHTLEAYDREDRLVGGLYGLQLGAAFFGESMFHTASDASKVALIHLVARMRLAGLTLLDTQFVTEHLARLGAIEIGRGKYMRLLDEAVARPAGRVDQRETPLAGREALAALSAI